MPVRLRPATAAAIGTTAFFRNRALLAALGRRLATLEQRQLSVLIHACSIGAEVWSLLIHAALDPRLRDKELSVHATDGEPDFVAFAASGVYPRSVLDGMHAQERAFFQSVDAHNVQVNDDLRRRVRFLPAERIEAFQADENFDVVFLLNVLLYVPAQAQSQVLDRIARYNRRLLVTTGFHLDRIKCDLVRNGYRPLGDAARLIHDSWLDRRRDVAVGDETVPGKIFHPWSLPAYAEIEDFEYKYCALFEKGDGLRPAPGAQG